MIIRNNKIKVNYMNVYDLSEEIIGIPMFQRFYAWKDKQIQQLIEDIDSLIYNQGELYLLDIIYYKDNNKIMLADGQQRIVTLNLMIKAINDYIEQNGIKIKKIKPFTIEYEIAEYDKKYKQTIEGYESAPFKTVYLNIKNIVEKYWSNHLPEVKNIIESRISVYTKQCENVDDAYQIFQQINTGGKPLTKDEIIKTALDQYSKIYQIPINTSKIKEIRQAILSYYKYVENDYNINFDNMLIMSFMKKYITNDIDLFTNFVNYLQQIKTNLGSPIDYVINYINRPLLHDVLNILSINNIDVTKNKKYQNQLMIPLCLSSITLSLGGGTPPLFKYLVNDIIKKLKANKPLEDINLDMVKYINKNASAFKMDYETFCEALDDSKCNTNMKKAILILDVLYRNNSAALIVDNINLEHVYPQKPKPIWYRNGWNTDEDVVKKAINSIGNMILLYEPVNKKIQNNYITDKIDEYNKIIDKDNVLQTKINTIDFVKFEKDKEAYIEERRNDIAKNIMDELPFGQVLFKK